MMLERTPGSGLGLSLAGHKDRTKMAVMVCGLNPNGPAAKSGCLRVGDEILEVCIRILMNSLYKITTIKSMSLGKFDNRLKNYIRILITGLNIVTHPTI